MAARTPEPIVYFQVFPDLTFLGHLMLPSGNSLPPFLGELRDNTFLKLGPTWEERQGSSERE